MSDCAVIRAVDRDSDDLADVAKIMAHYIENTVATFVEFAPTAADWERRHSELVAEGLPFLVAKIDGEVVGLAYAAPWRSKAAYRHTVENSVYLAPDAVGRGIGSALLTQLIALVTDAGYQQMIAVIADAGAPTSVSLHRRLGFVEAGRLNAVGFKLGRWVDTVLMQRALGPTSQAPS